MIHPLILKTYRSLQVAIADISARGVKTGGTSGQVATKASSDDFDWLWQNVPTGVKGLDIDSAGLWMTPAHEDRYLSFTAAGAKTYLVVLSDGFNQWNIVTIRNSAGGGNLTISAAFGVTLSGDQSKLLVVPGGTLQLVRANTSAIAPIWHIL